MIMKTKRTTSVVMIVLTTIFCVMCNVACTNSSTSKSSSDTTTGTVYSYMDGKEIYVVYDDGTVLDCSNGDTGVWNNDFTYIGNNEINYITITFNGHDPVCAICRDKIYWGGQARDVKEKYPNGQQLKSCRR